MKVRFSAPALAEMDDILSFIRDRSPRGAKAVRDRIDRCVRVLARFPDLGSVTDFPGLRCFPLNPYPYVVFYSSEGDGVMIHSVRHAARRPADPRVT